ncbi:MAG TPA: CcmD family protein [Terriglobales bacterium]|nr:CcmD family protein [Terriglobales bacterium]
MGSVIAAYSAAWIILMAYLLSLGARQRKLQKALAKLEQSAEPTRAAHVR